MAQVEQQWGTTPFPTVSEETLTNAKLNGAEAAVASLRIKNPDDFCIDYRGKETSLELRRQLFSQSNAILAKLSTRKLMVDASARDIVMNEFGVNIVQRVILSKQIIYCPDPQIVEGDVGV